MQDDNQAQFSILSISPSFNSYSSDTFAQTADRVTGELNRSVEDVVEEAENVEEEEEDDDDFEFSIVQFGAEADADKVFYDGQIRPIFPVFNRDLLLDDGGEKREFDGGDGATIRIPLKKLFFQDHEPPSTSSSSSEADELDGVRAGSYCVWAPKASPSPSPSPGRCKKSKSTGYSSKRWKLLDLLRRSSSDGTETFVFLTPSTPNLTKKKEEKSEKSEKSKEHKISGQTKAAGKSKAKVSSPHEIFYVKSRALKEEEKRRSYLPYRQDLVGFFARVNGLGRNHYPF